MKLKALHRHHLNITPRFDGGFLLCARQGALTWRCKSSTHPTGASVSRTARVPIVRWDLKEAEGKALARRIGFAYEASTPDEESNISKSDT